MKLHNPLPQSMQEDIKKCAHIMNKFSKKEIKGNSKVEKYIPPEIIANAKGVAIITVIKVGVLWSGRAGTGVVVARLKDGGWSAPSAIGTAGAGFGAQIGAELTDFVIILNTDAAVQAFSLGGNFTLGGNLSVSAGPFGRSGEVAGTVGKMAPIYSYSKSKGLFAGISLEGSAIFERKDGNKQFYGQKLKPAEILSGDIAAPPCVQPLWEALNKQANVPNPDWSNHPRLRSEDYPSYASLRSNSTMSSHYTAPNDLRRASNNSINSTPFSSNGFDGRRLSTNSPNSATAIVSTSHLSPLSASSVNSLNLPRYNLQPPAIQEEVTKQFNTLDINRSPISPGQKPILAPRPALPKRLQTATAIYDFIGEREGDLSFRAGDSITVTKKTGSSDDWWTGSFGGQSGDFPANYVELN